MKKNRAARLTACTLAVCMMLGTAGCSGREVSYDVDGNGSPAESSGLAGELGVPKSCDETFDTGESRLSSLTCSIDEISVPDSEEMKKVYYEVASFDADDIQRIVEAALDKGKGIYVRENSDVYTKDELNEMIEDMEEQLAADIDDSLTAYYESRIETYKSQLADAPDELPVVTDYSNVYGVYEGEKDGNKYSLSIQLYDEDNADMGIYISYRRDDSADAETISEVDGATYLYRLGASESDADIEDMTNECQMSSEAAEQTAMTFLDDIGISGVTPTITEPLVVMWEDDAADSEDLKTGLNGYSVTFRRDFIGDNRQSMYPMNADNLTKAQSDGYFYTVQDYIQVLVDDTGVVEMYGTVYSDYETLREEDVTLLSWDDMLKAVNENLSSYYVTYPTQYSDIEYNDVALVYMACADASGEKCFIPVWQFMEYEKMKTDNGDPFNVTQIAYINAVDGSVVDLIENAKGLNLWSSYN